MIIGYITSPRMEERYAQLTAIKGWRRTLSNFYARSDINTPLFILDGLKWRSVEHYYQANKFIDKDEKYYKSFALDSHSTLSTGNGADARNAGNNITMNNDEQKKWESCKNQVMCKAYEAKYIQNPDLAHILKLTHYANLLYRTTRRSKPVFEDGLMALRKKLIDMEVRKD